MEESFALGVVDDSFHENTSRILLENFITDPSGLTSVDLSVSDRLNKFSSIYFNSINASDVNSTMEDGVSGFFQSALALYGNTNPNGIDFNQTDLNIGIEIKQSNIEGDIVNIIQDARKTQDGIIINAAGYSHTSVAIRDALSIFKKPIIELHISNIYKREEFRHKSLISSVVTGIICGLGINGYILAINSMHEILNNEN